MAASSGTNVTRKMPQKKSVLNKKYPANPRYRNVKPVVDSGDTIRKYAENIEDQHRHFKLGRDEIFRRIRLESLVKLMIEVGYDALREAEIEKSNEQAVQSNGGSVESCVENSVDSNTDSAGDGRPDTRKQQESTVMTSRSTLHSVISGIGEMDLTANVESRQPIISTVERLSISKPYLLLDVRDKDSYNQSHMILALNYPHTMTSRSVNYETKDLLAFKNKCGTVIVVYDEDETYSQKVATTLVQRGYENVYLLSGGLRLAQQKFNGDLVCTHQGEMKSEFTVHDLENLQKSIDFHQMSTMPRSRRPSSLKDYDKTARMSDQREVRRQADELTRASSVSSLRLSRKPWK